MSPRERQRKRLWNSRGWQRRRRWLIEYHGGRCKTCGTTDGLTLHHLTYERLGWERVEDVEVLCRPCHDEVHQREGTPS